MASSPRLMKSAVELYDSDDSPLLQIPPSLPHGAPNLADSANLRTIATSLFNLQQISTQVARQTLKMQTKAVATKRMKESAMSAQTKDTIRTTKVFLLSKEGHEGQPIIADKLHFSTAMEDLMERPSLGHISNQVLQIIQHYNCSPHMPLWLKMIKITGFLAPEGCWYGGLSLWIYRPGYYTSSDDQNSTKLRLSVELEGQGKTSREDFNKILGSTHYAEPKVAEDAAKM